MWLSKQCQQASFPMRSQSHNALQQAHDKSVYDGEWSYRKFDSKFPQNACFDQYLCALIILYLVLSY